MNTWIKSCTLSLLVLGLAACASEPSEAPVEEPMAEEPMTEEPMAEEPMVEAPMAASEEAQSNCLAAVAEQVGVESGDLSILSSDASEAGTSVMISVPEAEQPWNCVVDTDGSSVVEVYYMGEG